MSVAQVLGPQGRLARGMPNYEVRQVQLEMAAAVDQVLQEDGVLLVEAGTGTGKTLAYLVPALLSGRKVVVSTGTRTLQDQIMQHDLPLLTEYLDSPVSAACMKGLNNYLCLRRFEEFRNSAASVRSKSAAQLPVLEHWRQSTESGDRAELEELSESAAVWAQVQSGSDTRVGPRCDFHDECYVTRMRDAAARAQLVVVNHHLYFADLALRGSHGGGVIPDHDVVIFDEAHLLEDIATDFFGVSVSTARLEVLMRDAERALASARLLPEAQRLVSHAGVCASSFFAQLPQVRGGEGGRVPLPPEVFDERVRQPMFDLDNALDALASFCKRNASESESVAQMGRRAHQVRDDIASIAEGGGDEQVTWTQSRGRSVSIGASPIDLGELFRENLYYRTPAVVMTSATLSTAGSFRFIRSRLGVDFDAQELSLQSPFDYPQQAALYLPDDMGDPRDQGFLKRAAERILELITLADGGAFVLCTSIRAMRDLHARCAPQLSRPVMLQGEAPQVRLLERFREAGDAVLFATASFWQGVDVPGRALRLVIIDKLPFDVPTDPLIEARCAQLKAQGEQPFIRYLVPAAALSLKQGFGRLIRSRRDRGMVAILDGRIRSKGYGKVFVRSLPPARRCNTLLELEEFWNTELEPSP